jgi:hypothetical protein
MLWADFWINRPLIKRRLIVSHLNSVDSSLIDACRVGDSKKVNVLLTEGADIEAKDNYSCTALMRASHNGHVEVVKALLDVGADTEAKTTVGFTALMRASENGHLEIVKALLKAGAAIDHQTNNDRTALSIASDKDHKEVVKVFHDYIKRLLLNEFYADISLTRLQNLRKQGGVGKEMVTSVIKELDTSDLSLEDMKKVIDSCEAIIGSSSSSSRHNKLLMSHSLSYQQQQHLISDYLFQGIDSRHLMLVAYLSITDKGDILKCHKKHSNDPLVIFRTKVDQKVKELPKAPMLYELHDEL